MCLVVAAMAQQASVHHLSAQAAVGVALLQVSSTLFRGNYYRLLL
jgi:hypothetical protein